MRESRIIKGFIRQAKFRFYPEAKGILVMQGSERHDEVDKVEALDLSGFSVEERAGLESG